MATHCCWSFLTNDRGDPPTLCLQLNLQHFSALWLSHGSHQPCGEQRLFALKCRSNIVWKCHTVASLLFGRNSAALTDKTGPNPTKHRSFPRGKIVFVRYFDLFEFPKSPLSSPNYYIRKWFPKRCPLFRTLSAIVSSAI